MFRRRADSPPGPSTHHTVSPHATPDALRHTQHHTGTIADTAPYHAHTSPDRPPLHHARAGMCMGGAPTVCPPPLHTPRQTHTATRHNRRATPPHAQPAHHTRTTHHSDCTSRATPPQPRRPGAPRRTAPVPPGTPRPRASCALRR